MATLYNKNIVCPGSYNPCLSNETREQNDITMSGNTLTLSSCRNSRLVVNEDDLMWEKK